MKTYYQNDVLKAALRDSKTIYKSMKESFDFDDDQLKVLEVFENLSQFDRDLIYLSSVYPVSEIANMYNVTRQYIYKLLHKVQDKIHNQL